MDLEKSSPAILWSLDTNWNQIGQIDRNGRALDSTGRPLRLNAMSPHQSSWEPHAPHFRSIEKVLEAVRRHRDGAIQGELWQNHVPIGLVLQLGWQSYLVPIRNYASLRRTGIKGIVPHDLLAMVMLKND